MMKRAIGLAWLVVFAACADDEIDPITKIDGPRVLAITSEPSTLSPDGTLELTVMTVDAEGPRVEIAASVPNGERPVDAVRLRACTPWKFIADPSRDCSGDDALPLERDASTGRISLSASALVAAFGSPPGVPATPDPWRTALAAGVELWVPIIGEVDIDGQTLVARRDIGVTETTTVRRNPRIAEIRFDGSSSEALRSGQRYVLTATIDRATLDEPPAVEPTGTLEMVACNFYSTGGELAKPEVDVEDPQASLPETTANTYTAGPPGTTWMFVVATDETGGMSAVSIPLTIE